MKKIILYFLFIFSSSLINAQDAYLRQILKNYKCSEEFKEQVLPFLENLGPTKIRNVQYIPLDRSESIVKHYNKKPVEVNELGNIKFSKIPGEQNVLILKTTTSSGYELMHFCTFRWESKERIWYLESQILNEKIKIRKSSWLIFIFYDIVKKK